jgi:dTDP-4-dehydrorhamnose reductase
MLGSEVATVAKSAGFDVVEVSRKYGLHFDAETSQFSDLAHQLGLSSTDYVVNCIGWIPQKSSGDANVDRQLATLLNVELPRQINESAESLGFNWIQIGTDCVFDGTGGAYVESSQKNAQDLYGASKIQGERLSSRAMLIRASIIGPDRRTNAGLYAWFMSEMKSGKVVSGYQNHFWNGVSTRAFARLVIGIAKMGKSQTFTAHWLPKDSVTKYSLLKLFAKKLGYPSGVVQAAMGEVATDRTLATENTQRNAELWQIAGYQDVPTIEQLVAELVLEDLNQRS